MQDVTVNYYLSSSWYTNYFAQSFLAVKNGTDYITKQNICVFCQYIGQKNHHSALSVYQFQQHLCSHKDKLQYRTGEKAKKIFALYQDQIREWVHRKQTCTVQFSVTDNVEGNLCLTVRSLVNSSLNLNQFTQICIREHNSLYTPCSIESSGNSGNNHHLWGTQLDRAI